MSEAYRYQAFVSYSHADRKWGEWVHRSLESFVVPAGLKSRSGQPSPKRLAPVFRDREELSSSADLGAQISSALSSSRTLIVVCSPRAARSRWVNEEVRQFKALGRAARIYCLVVDGAPNATERGDVERECFPPAVRHDVGADGQLLATRCEPMAADVRAEADGRTLGLLKVVAGMLEVDLATLTLREQRQRRQRLIVGASLVLAVLALVLSQQIINGRRVAEERDEAERRLAESLVARSAALMARQRFDAAKPLLADARAVVSKLGRSTLAADFGRQLALAESPDPLSVMTLHRHAIRGLAVSGDGETLASLDAVGVVAAWRLRDPARGPVWTAQVGAPGLAIGVDDADGLVLAVLEDGSLRAFKATDGTPAGQWPLAARPGASLRLASIDDGSFIAAGYSVADADGGVHGEVNTWSLDPATGPRREGALDLSTIVPHRSEKVFEFSVRPSVPSALTTRTREGRREVLVGALDGLFAFSPGTDEPPRELRGFAKPSIHALMQPHHVVSVAWSTDGLLAAATSDNAFDLWDTDDTKRVSLRHFASGNTSIVVLDSDPLQLAIGGGDGTVGVLSADDETAARWTLSASSAATTKLASTGRGALLAGKADGSIELWSSDPPRKQATWSGIGMGPSFDESPHGPLVVSGLDASEVMLLDPQTLSVVERIELDDSVYRAFAGPTPSTFWLTRNDEVIGFDLTTRRALFTAGPTDLKDQWAVTPDRTSLVIWREDGTLEEIRWGGTERRALGSLEGPSRQLQFDGAGNWLALSSGDEVQVVSWPQWKPVLSKKLVATEKAEAMAFSLDGSRVALALDTTRLSVLRVPDGEVVATMIGHSVSPSALAFATDAPDVLVSGSQDGSVRLWNAETGVELVSALGIAPVLTLTVTRRGKVLAGALGDPGLYGELDAYVWNSDER